MTDVVDPPAPAAPAQDQTPAGISELELEHGAPRNPTAGEADRRLLPTWPSGFDAAQAANYVVLAACTIFIFATLNRGGGLLSTSTPTGGDMGAHVWGPDYLKDILLPSLRLSGWSQDWYAGFPAYTFYMVVPALAIVMLDAGLPPLIGLPLLVVLVPGLVYGWSMFTARLARAAMLVAAVVILPLCVDVDPNVAFKLVSVSGLLAMPWAAFFLGTSLRLRFPGPMLMSMAALAFVWDSHFTIYGGNVASTMAGEFSFSIAFAVTLVFLGVVARGLSTGRHRAIAATLLGLVALCHVIPLFFAVGATAMMFLLRPGWRQMKWLMVVMPTGALLSAFWIVPFYLRSDYLNDMGWEKVGPAVNGAASTYWQYLLPNAMPYHEIIFGLAVIGAVLSIVRANRAGLTFALWSLFGVGGFILMPQGRFWNARVLPFYILSLDLLAAVAVTLLIGALAAFVTKRERLQPVVSGILAGAAVITVFLAVGLPIGLPPSAKSTSVNAPTVVEDQSSVPQLSGHQFGPFLSTQSNKATGWASWNFGGLQAKERYPEYSALMSTMARVGKERGCGRAMWEYYKQIEDYGTPMAPMLLPYFTDGCIGSMEGLYFEASMTTPFHFLNQSLLSKEPSRPQRDLPYEDLDVAEGVKRLQLYGVKYYLSRSEEATQQARALTEGPDAPLTEVAEVPSQNLAGDSGVLSEPWVVFEVAGSELVSGLDHEPIVMTDVAADHAHWLDPTVAWYGDTANWSTFLAADGPKDWTRVRCGARADEVGPESPYGFACQGAVPGTPITPAKVSNIVVEQQSMSFTVDQVGKPVLVKTSYFPNWRADGAEGPYRVAPNLMVVVPTQKNVSLSYGRSGVEWLGMALSLAGVVIVVLLLVVRTPRFPRAWQFAGDAEPGDPTPREALVETGHSMLRRNIRVLARISRSDPVGPIDGPPPAAGNGPVIGDQPDGGTDPDATAEPSPDWMISAQEPAEIDGDPPPA
ncbi:MULTISPECIES: hypothetical protein [Candidatus Neomicrothrix]|jgi:hypothetical protein|uniref:Membrane protein 6-pyruvoyl-tetrahydropterin synthase-related domain-containing protein n=1 Tax=Candidatus Neomicrothrix parvicella RN1 TaxID=1229780 RepID=R4YVW7_9ACTN|nr:MULTISPECIES: hypothetical protein [Microthrix]NLH67718.1 hypothetical protein [Candidatus Microthrix parvicella]MBK6501182.1 hypothetical protein [Candidatus Microthrix sp.]MBK7323580.1 hypothetical protein [Candidatus Microthrix sp.]MBL0205380.1 hypothetical protein [Candidatus Microthrix sp.]MBP6134035.1 hypothetical protein [Candidatus Microthrix sp.]